MANSRSFLRREQRQGGERPDSEYQEVARVAYELYEQRGRVDGYDLDDWLKAESIVRQQQALGSRSRLAP